MLTCVVRHYPATVKLLSAQAFDEKILKPNFLAL
jgi:hypothetical protein